MMGEPLIWTPLDDLRDSWGPLSEGLDALLDDELDDDQESTVFYRPLPRGFEILIHVVRAAPADVDDAEGDDDDDDQGDDE